MKVDILKDYRYNIKIMTKYTDQITYIQQDLSFGEIFTTNAFPIIQNKHPIQYRAFNKFDHEHYKYPSLPLFLGIDDIDVDNINVNVLRLLISEPKYANDIYLPKELMSIKDFILSKYNYWFHLFNNFTPYIYLTVRTITDIDNNNHETAKVWHVDGFQGTRINRHLPEQSILWSNILPTEYLLQPFDLEDFDYSKYNVHNYFDFHAKQENIYVGEEKGSYVIDPYTIHRATNKPLPQNKKRVMIRITFSQVEIPDHTNTINPMLPKTYCYRDDVRNNLTDCFHYMGVSKGFKTL